MQEEAVSLRRKLIIDELKVHAMDLCDTYEGHKVKIELNVNSECKEVKVNVTEFEK